MPYRPDDDAVGLLPDSRQATHCWNDDGALPPVLAEYVPELVDVPVLAERCPSWRRRAVVPVVPVVADAGVRRRPSPPRTCRAAGAW